MFWELSRRRARGRLRRNAYAVPYHPGCCGCTDDTPRLHPETAHHNTPKVLSLHWIGYSVALLRSNEV